MKKIPVYSEKYGNTVALVDDKDFALVSKHRWHLNKQTDRLYVRTNVKVGNRYRGKLLHRLILKAPKNKMVDHKDGDMLNNQRNNIRVCTPSQNAMNKNKTSQNKSGYKGVYWHVIKKQFCAEICIKNKTINLGYSMDVKKLALVYNKAAKKHFGKFARLNKI